MGPTPETSWWNQQRKRIEVVHKIKEHEDYQAYNTARLWCMRWKSEPMTPNPMKSRATLHLYARALKHSNRPASRCQKQDPATTILARCPGHIVTLVLEPLTSAVSMFSSISMLRCAKWSLKGSGGHQASGTSALKKTSQYNCISCFQDISYM